MTVRICSLLPSATEIVCALGLRDQLVAVTHECDFPSDLGSIPRVTSSVVDSETLSSRDIDTAIKQALENLSTIYFLDREKLAELQPDLIITQELCEVCAVSFDRVQSAAQSMCPSADVVSLEPSTIVDIFETIQLVAGRAGAGPAGTAVVAGLDQRVERIHARTQGLRLRPRVLALEWLDPPFIGGHWVPGMIDSAGGRDALGKPGQRSRQVSWQEVAAARPDVIVLMPCGFDLDRTVSEFERVTMPEAWSLIPAVQSRSVYAVDGSAYFNRPGPRIVDGIEILARILQPGVFGPAGTHEAVQMV